MYALITGATSGIGKEITKILANVGYDLILVGRRQKRLDYMEKYFSKKYGTHVITYSYDLSEPENSYKLFENTKELEIDVVVNAAGFGKVGYATDSSLEDDVDMINTNITSLHILTKLFAGHMYSGHILNVASIAAFQPGPFLATYSATKSYVLSYSLAMNYELRRLGKDVKITTLCPGPVKTEFDDVAGTNFNLKSISAKECAFLAVCKMFKGRSVVIPSLKIKLARIASKLAPNKLILPVEFFIQTSKMKNE